MPRVFVYAEDEKIFQFREQSFVVVEREFSLILSLRLRLNLLVSLPALSEKLGFTSEKGCLDSSYCRCIMKLIKQHEYLKIQSLN